ncbi:Alpha-2A adrenergic receptor [Dissostichus eleginoides]|uniref:Alpha-2A adrenergic receptor n=3 Tax=Notothenioidei TaxID=8205 RepID=A0AAD9CTQ1_DISEL|nr:Alpha-2A adrenergic receptor [Dissostichus eleginoides]
MHLLCHKFHGWALFVSQRRTGWCPPSRTSPEHCVAPPRGTKQTHIGSRLATDCEIQVEFLPGHVTLLREEQETKELFRHVTDIRFLWLSGLSQTKSVNLSFWMCIKVSHNASTAWIRCHHRCNITVRI